MSDRNLEECDLELLEKMKKIGTEKTLEFIRVLSEIGLDPKEKGEWIQIFLSNVLEIYDGLLQEVKEKQSFLMENIEKLLQKSEVLCKELKIDLPKYGSNSLPLYKEEEYLREKVLDLKTLLESRKTEFNAIKKKELELCKCLGFPSKITSDELPSEAEITILQKYLESLENEKFKREEEYFVLKCEIVELVNELSYKTMLDFESMVVNSEDSLFIVSETNMNDLRLFHGSLKQQLEEAKVEIEELSKKVRELWEILDEDLQCYQPFIDSLPTLTSKKIEVLRSEVSRCESLKKANIEIFVNKLRNEIKSLWEKCKYTNDQCNEFQYFHINYYTEDLLSHHDLHVNKLRKYYDDNKELFELLDKRENLWKKMLEFEQKENSKDRFKNRGGELLKEEKERNALKKNIPQIEKQLMDLADAYEEKSGRPFLVWGETVEHVIKNYYDERENEKKMKLSARKQKENPLTPAKSYLSVAGSSQNLLRTPLTNNKTNLTNTRTPMSSKRKLQVPTLSEGKRKKLFATPEVVPKSKNVKMKRNLKRVQRRSGNNLEKKKENREESVSTSSDYFSFINKISDNCRSTIFDGNFDNH